MSQDTGGELTVSGEVTPVAVSAREQRITKGLAASLVTDVNPMLKVTLDADGVRGSLVGSATYGASKRIATNTVPIPPEDLEAIRDVLQGVIDKNLPELRSAVEFGVAQAIVAALRMGENL